MLELHDALAMVTDLACRRRVGLKRVDLPDAFHRILAQDIVLDTNTVPFRGATWDDLACCRTNLRNDQNVVETVTAGTLPCRTLLRAGELIEAADIAVLAGVGCSRLWVSRRPTVGVIATGSELVEPDRRPGPGRIRNSNSFQLSAMVLAASAVPRNYGLVADDRDAIRAILRKAISENDAVVLSGGISQGDYDLVRGILQEDSVELLFDRVGPAPGRPVVFADFNTTLCFGLSGHPVSNFVTFELLVKPFLYALAGHRFRPAVARGKLIGAVRRRKMDRDLWLPVVLGGDGCVRPLQSRRSGGLLALCDANGLVHVPAGVAGFAEGIIVTVRRI